MIQPLVSVVIPAYNKANYTQRCVDSVLAQEYSPIEIIVVNDGSTDHTDDLMKAYGNRIVYVKKGNGGACSARNLGAKIAKGDFLAFLDCDDLYCSDKIGKSMNFLIRNPQCLFVYHAAFFIDREDKIISIYNHRFSHKPTQISRLLINENFICNSTPVIRRDAFNKVGGFDENIFSPADWDLWLKLTSIGQVGYINEPLTKYRVADNYIFNKLEKSLLEELIVIQRYFSQKSKNNNLQSKALAFCYLRFAQCYFIKNNIKEFHSLLQQAMRHDMLNLKSWILLFAAQFFRKELYRFLRKRILRLE